MANSAVIAPIHQSPNAPAYELLKIRSVTSSIPLLLMLLLPNSLQHTPVLSQSLFPAADSMDTKCLIILSLPPVSPANSCKKSRGAIPHGFSHSRRKAQYSISSSCSFPYIIPCCNPLDGQFCLCRLPGPHRRLHSLPASQRLFGVSPPLLIGYCNPLSP